MSSTLNEFARRASLFSIRRLIVIGLVLLPVLSVVAWALAHWRIPEPDEVLQVDLGANVPAVAVDVFRPAVREHNQRSPAVVLLPGVEGAKYGAPEHYRRARQLADEGYTTFVVHYLEPCNYEHLYFLTEDGKNLDKEKINAVVRRDHMRWHDTVLKTIGHIANRPDIDPQRLGVLGYSLGCFVGSAACDSANRDPSTPDIVAFVGNWGSRFEHIQCDPSFPACRLFHGQDDTIIPVAWAQQFQSDLQEVRVDAKLRVFPGEGHIVRDPAAWCEARDFFKQTLQQPELTSSLPDLLIAPTTSRDFDLRNLCY